MRLVEWFSLVCRLVSFAAEILVNPISDNAAKPGAEFRRLAQMSEMFAAMFRTMPHNHGRKLYAASAASIVLGVGVWTALLVGGVVVFSRRMEREVKRIRIDSNTTDEAYAKVLAAEGRSVRLPKYFESQTRFLGLPLFAVAWGGSNADRNRSRRVVAWFAVGDIAISPFVAVGGVAVGPIAIGGLTVGVLSLRLFWGVAFGVMSVSSLEFGWWAVGCGAAGVKRGVGFAATAPGSAVGM